MINYKKFPKVFTLIFSIYEIIFSIYLYILDYKPLLIFCNIVISIIIIIVVISFCIGIFKTINTLQETINEHLRDEESFNKEMELIKNTSYLNKESSDRLIDSINILRKYGLSYNIRYDHKLHGFYIITKCKMSSYTKMSLSHQLSSIVVYQIDGTDVMLTNTGKKINE